MNQFNKHTDHTTTMLFIASALPTAAMHKSENIEHIYSTGAEIVATDGHRLHIYSPEECPLEAGYYAIIKKTKTELILNRADLDLDYPDYKRIMPEEENTQDFAPGASTDGKYATVIRALDCNTINYKYFQEAAPLMDSYQVTDGTRPVLMIGESVKAVVMPVRL